MSTPTSHKYLLTKRRSTRTDMYRSTPAKKIQTTPSIKDWCMKSSSKPLEVSPVSQATTSQSSQSFCPKSQISRQASTSQPGRPTHIGSPDDRSAKATSFTRHWTSTSPSPSTKTKSKDTDGQNEWDVCTSNFCKVRIFFSECFASQTFRFKF